MSKYLKVDVFTAKYEDEKLAKIDYYKSKKVYEKNNSIDTFNAAIIFKNKFEKIDIIIKNEDTVLINSWIGAIIGITITLMILFLIIPEYFTVDRDLKAVYAIAGIVLGALLGTLCGWIIAYFNSTLHKNDLNKLSELLKINEYALVIISIDNISEEIQKIIKIPNKVKHIKFETTKKELIKKIRQAFIS